MRVFSFGGGVQSMAVLVLGSQGAIDYDAYLFCNVGEDSENPETLVYYRKFAEPFAAEHGLNLIELSGPRTLLEHVNKSQRSLPIPVRMQNGAPGRRTCTTDYKILRVGRWTKRHGATEAEPATVGIGISVDEWKRVKNRHSIAWEVVEHPLIARNLNRNDCANLITATGLPVPPKSSCWFCPFHHPTEWRRQQTQRPDLFTLSVSLEAMLNERRETHGLSQVFLSRFGKPLDRAFAGLQPGMFDEVDEGCDEGYCYV